MGKVINVSDICHLVYMSLFAFKKDRSPLVLLFSVRNHEKMRFF